MEKKKAVALKYPKDAYAPFVMAKGEGELADLILQEAKKNNINITEDKEMVEFLSSLEISSYVPEEIWESLAQIFAFILEND